MKRIIILAVLTLTLVGLNAQVSTNADGSIANIVVNGVTYAPVDTNAVSDGKAFGGYEITLGGAGATIKGKTEFGMDFSISTNPFEKLPSIWLGVAQGLYWEPTFAGSTDVFADWNTHLIGELYLNTGWSVGALYDTKSAAVYRTGPEVSLQYYTSDNAFIYAGANYDFVTKGDSGIRYSFGLGLSF